MKHNDQLERNIDDLQGEFEKLKAKLEFEKSKLSNGVLLEETFCQHPYLMGSPKILATPASGF